MVNLSRLKELTEQLNEDLHHPDDCKTLELIKFIFDNISIFAQIVDKNYDVIYSNSTTIEFHKSLGFKTEGMYKRPEYQSILRDVFISKEVKKCEWESPITHINWTLVLIPILNNGVSAILIIGLRGEKQ